MGFDLHGRPPFVPLPLLDLVDWPPCPLELDLHHFLRQVHCVVRSNNLSLRMDIDPTRNNELSVRIDGLNKKGVNCFMKDFRKDLI